MGHMRDGGAAGAPPFSFFMMADASRCEPATLEIMTALIWGLSKRGYCADQTSFKSSAVR
jgi:hypothetical protein